MKLQKIKEDTIRLVGVDSMKSHSKFLHIKMSKE